MKTASGIKMAATVASVVRASTRPGGTEPPGAGAGRATPRALHRREDVCRHDPQAARARRGGGRLRRVPIDLLPEAILPVVGAADDAVVISWAIKAFFEETDRFIAWEAGQGVRVRPSRPPRERVGVPG